MTPKVKPKTKSKPIATTSIAEIQQFASQALESWLLIVPVAMQFEVPEGLSLESEVSIITEAKMIAVNHKFRRKKEVTDVLSFPAPDLYQAQGYLGELVICGPVLLNQAKSVGQTWQQEVHILLVHGLLHLLGFDHEVSAEASKRMAHFEAEMLYQGKKLGLIEMDGLIARNRAQEKKWKS